MTNFAIYQKIMVILIIISFLGCSTHQPIEAQPRELQDKIRYENIVKVSDEVKIFTEDGKEHRFRITSIDENEIVGSQMVWKTKDKAIKETYRIPIDSIVALETKEFSMGKTALLTGGIIAGLGLLFLISFGVAAASLMGGAP